MKRLAVSTLTAACGLLLATTAHASYFEKGYVEDPEWKTQQEVDAETEARVDARTTVKARSTDRGEGFDATDDGTDARFGDMLKKEDIRFEAETSITRAEFTAMFVRSRYGRASIDSCFWNITSVVPPRFELLFRDVSVDHEFAPEICVAMRDGLVRGYGDDVFRPDALITFADAAKIIARAEGLTPWADPSQPKHWFDIYVSALARRNAIPMSVEKIEENITPAEASEMMRRLREDDRTQPSRGADEMIAAWEKTYERPAAPARKPVMNANVPAKPSFAGSASSRGTAASSARSSVAPSSAAASADADSSRPKAWYEF